MKRDEKELLKLIYELSPGRSIREILSSELDIDRNRARYLLNKNTNKGLYDYGVALDLGWLTEEGVQYIEKNILS